MDTVTWSVVKSSDNNGVPRYLLGQSDDLRSKVHFQVENISLANLA